MKHYIKKHLISFLGLISFILVKVIFQNRFSILKGQLIDSAIGKTNTPLSQFLIHFAIVLIIYLSSSYILGIIRFGLRMNIIKDLKDDFFISTLKRNRIDIRNLDISKAISSYTAEINLIDQNFLDKGGHLLEYVFSIVITLTSIAIIDFKMALVSLAVYVLPVFFTKSQQNKLTQAQQDFQTENDHHTKSFLQNLKGVEVIKNYNIEENIFKIFDKSLNKLVGADIKRADTRARIIGMSSVLTYFSQAIIAGLSVYLVFTGDISAGDFVSIFSLSASISSQVYWLAQSVEAVLSAQPAINSISGYIDYPQESDAKTVIQKTNDDNIAIQIENLSLSFGKRNILEDLNFTVNKGEKILILGASGTGKSSLMSLIAGYLQPSNGTIRFLSENRNSLLTMVDQETFIFRGTLEDNLFVETSKDKEKVETLINDLGLNAIYNEFKSIDERGRNLSGGERKRLALARGVLRNSQIIILDEPLANVDSENIERIENLILGMDRTVIIISHQVSSHLFNGMDKVYKLISGNLINIKKEKTDLIGMLENSL